MLEKSAGEHPRSWEMIFHERYVVEVRRGEVEGSWSIKNRLRVLNGHGDAGSDGKQMLRVDCCCHLIRKLYWPVLLRCQTIECH